MPEAINDGRRNVHHLFCSGIAKMLFLDQNRNVIIKKKVSPQFSGHLIFLMFSKEIRLLFYLEK